MVPEALFENPDGTPILFNTGYFEESREEDMNRTGPFSNLRMGKNTIKLWPR